MLDKPYDDLSSRMPDGVANCGRPDLQALWRDFAGMTQEQENPLLLSIKTAESTSPEQSTYYSPQEWDAKPILALEEVGGVRHEDIGNMGAQYRVTVLFKEEPPQKGYEDPLIQENKFTPDQEAVQTPGLLERWGNNFDQWLRDRQERRESERAGRYRPQG